MSTPHLQTPDQHTPHRTHLPLLFKLQVITPQRSLALLKTLDPSSGGAVGEGAGGVSDSTIKTSASSVVATHPGGHMIPAKGTAKSAFKAFMVEQHNLQLY